MNHSLSELEVQRNSLYKQLEKTGDFRRGTIYLNYRKCGKKNCICAKPGQPGHGPQYLWSTTIKGKSYAKSLKLGPELRKYMDEIDNYHSFLRICNEILQLNEKICDSRPVVEIEDNSEAEELKKNLKMQFEKKYKKKLNAL